MFSDLTRDAAARGDGKVLRVPGRLEFTLSGQEPALVSGLRRSIMTDVKTAAFRFDAVDPSAQDVRVLHNTGNLHNEMIGERVGLLPLGLSKAELVDFRPASWRFELDVENKGKRPLDVTSADFTVLPLDDSPALALNPANVFRPDPLTGRHPLITVLMPGQRLALEATASLGSGSDHARHSPACACAMHPLQDRAAVDRERKKRDDKASFDALEAPRMLDLDGKGRPRGYRFQLESACGMSPEDIVESGLEALAGRLRALAGSARVSEVEPQSGCAPDIHSLKLEGEDHTAAALIQSRLLDRTDFAGYYVPHLLEKSVVMRVRVPEGGGAREMLREACEEAADECEAALEAWQRFVRRKK